MRRKLFFALTLLMAVGMQAQAYSVAITMPDAQALYDFNGDGLKQVAQQFSNIVYIEDVNHDGTPDFTTCSDKSNLVNNTQLWLSSGTEYINMDGAFAVTNMDINRDGRIDYLIFNNTLGSAYGAIAYQNADGSFRIEQMELINSPANNVPVRRSPGISHQLSAPTAAIDLNNDGLFDLVDEKNGVLFINRGNGQWEWKEMNYTLIPVDLNTDGYMDFVMTGDGLCTAIYNASTQDYTITTVSKSGKVDDIVYCKDFDGDGDIDLLATYSAIYNGDVSYTMLFTNNGQGKFTKKGEQNYGYDNKLWFSALQDLDGDGYYDLLAFRGEITYYRPNPWYEAYQALYTTAPEVVWLRGNANNTFATPQKLYDSNFGGGSWGGDAYLWTQGSTTPSDYPRNAMQLHIQAEDLDADGTMRVWASGGPNTGDSTVVCSIPAITPNVRPTAPAAPTIQYTNGLLTVTWGNGADEKTAVSDLTYALRIGTTAGGKDILAAHANADGSRRNFLDGNMGNAHSYTIDLRSYAPSNIYIAVQAIDAQHMGSEWSQEATIAHSSVPIEFTFSKNPIAFGDTVEVHYTALPEEYTHSWRYADGMLVKDTTYLALTFPTGGRKTITHIVTAPNGQKDSVSAELIVLSAALGEPMEVSIFTSNILQRPLADYTFDGRMDGVSVESYSMSVYEGVNTDAFFRKALGMWNSNILGSDESITDPSYVRWYDYDRDGNVDLLFRTSKNTYGKLLHDPWSAALTERVDDPNLAMIFDWYNPGGGYGNYYYTLNEDLRHTGTIECIQKTFSSSGTTTQIVYLDENGNTALKNFTIIGNASQFYTLINDKSTFRTADFDHDGFADIAGIDQTTGDGTSSELILFYNRGNGVYEQGNIPFPEALPPFTTALLTDFNGDGYIDVLAAHSNYWDTEHDVNFGRVYWNNANLSFTRFDLPESTKAESNRFVLTDIDNNGHTDMSAVLYDQSKDAYGIYAWYMDAEGLMSHGYIAEGLERSVHSDVYLAPDDHRLFCNNSLYPIIAQADARPAAPTNIQATMTDEGLLLTWNAAVDDHTPAALMRYNLSMKLQGAETYLFSPQNGENENAAYIPGYNYINATRFLIPKSLLSNGNYEVRLQAVDNQNKMSLFSETFIAVVARNPIEMPTDGCSYSDITIVYQGADTSGTPTWNFDGGNVSSGSGFGPYLVYWETGGKKVVTLTIGEQTYADTININNPYDLTIYPPQELYEDVPATIELPEGVTCEWYVKLNNETEWHQVTTNGIYYIASPVIYYDRRLKAEGTTITAYFIEGQTSLCDEAIQARFYFTNTEGCTGYYEYNLVVRSQTVIPTLTLVTTNADGHNVIAWSNVDAFSTINVYKEGNTLDDFQLIGSVNATEGSFIDTNSDATQKAERYYVTGISVKGESPESAIHKTVHLTINRGVQNGTFNLIWNEYIGAAVTSYNILRGATPSSLTQIASVASSNTSFTDRTPEDAQPYYAIEYVLRSAANAPSANRAPKASLSGRSNVVDRRNAEEGIEDISIDSSNAPRKIMVDNVIYILRGDRIYTITGQELR